jgi:hypothetical protein
VTPWAGRGFRLTELIMNYWILLTPVLGMFFGWLIHFLSIRFLFTYWLPKKKELIAQKAGIFAASEFKNFNMLEEKINDPKNLESILPVIETHIDKFLNEKLKEEMPMISMFIGTKTTDKLKAVFMREIQLLFPQVISQFAGNLKSGLDINGIVTKRIQSIPPSTLLQFARTEMARPVRAFLFLGVFTGFLTGLLFILLTVLTS